MAPPGLPVLCGDKGGGVLRPARSFGRPGQAPVYPALALAPGPEGGNVPAWGDGWRGLQSYVSGTVIIEGHGLGIPGATWRRRLGPPHPSTAPLTQAFRANRQKQLHLVCNEILTSKGRAAVSWDWAPGRKRLCSWPMPDSAGHRAKSRRTFDHLSPGSRAGGLRSLVTIC